MATERKARRLEKNPKTDAPVLTLKVSGPGIRRGRIAVPDLIRICQEAQTAVTRQAEAIEGRKTIHPGPTTKQIRHECTLELIGIRKGSTALDFALAKPQLALPFEEIGSFGSIVVEEIADTINSLGNGNKKRDVDPGVLQSIYGLGSVLGAGGITELDWIAPKSGRKRIVGSVSKKVRDRAAVRLSQPTFKVVKVDGILDMADFSRRDRKCRIDPAIGAPVLCTFSPEFEGKVQKLLRQPVRVTGIGRIQPHLDRVDSLEIQELEPLPSLSLGEGNFFSSPTIQQLASFQGTTPVHDLKTLEGFLADDEVEPFIAEIYHSRGRVMNDPIVDAVLVDTDVFSYLMSGKNYARLYHPHLEGKLMAISFITVGELYFGAYKKKWGPERLENLKDRLRSVTIVPYDEGVCKRYAEIKAAVESKGKAVSDNDLWIAACSIRHAIPLITNNRRHFDEVPGLVVISESQAMREMQSQMSIPAEVTPEPGAPSQPPSKSPAGVEKPVTPRSRNRS